MKPTDRDLAGALAPLVALLAPLLKTELATGELDPWLDQASSPLGRRAHVRACRAGRIAGARLVGRRWLARSSACDAYIEAHVPPQIKTASGAPSDLETSVAALGFAPGARRRGRR